MIYERLKIVFLLACIALALFLIWQLLGAQFGQAVLFRIPL